MIVFVFTVVCIPSVLSRGSLGTSVPIFRGVPSIPIATLVVRRVPVIVPIPVPSSRQPLITFAIVTPTPSILIFVSSRRVVIRASRWTFSTILVLVIAIPSSGRSVSSGP